MIPLTVMIIYYVAFQTQNLSFKMISAVQIDIFKIKIPILKIILHIPTFK